MTAARLYAWCFSHGRTHYFYPDDTPWCTALWVYLAGATEEEAEADKQARYGDARFLDELPDVEAQAAVMQLSQQQRPEEQP